MRVEGKSLENLSRASYTIEAAILVPIFLFMMAAAMKLGMDLYQDIKEKEEVDDLWEVSDFYKNEWVEELSSDES